MVSKEWEVGKLVGFSQLVTNLDISSKSKPSLRKYLHKIDL